MERRDFLKNLSLVGGVLLPMAPGLVRAMADPEVAKQAIGPERAFDYAWLKGHARWLAGRSWQSPRIELPEAIRDLSWDQYQAIGYKAEEAIWADDPASRFRLEFFHLGRQFRTPVKMFEVSEGQAREIVYQPHLFDFEGSGVDPEQVPEGLGFAGFQVFQREDWQRDVCAFLGASYFRAVGKSMQYGMSARGLAVNTGLPQPEEFPIFTHFWFEHPEDGADQFSLYALLDSPSVAGAYRFILHDSGGDMTMDVDAAIYPRNAIKRLGVAPLTSMYLVGENDEDANWDWRPEIHDSDGLYLHTGQGEWIWRPLANPGELRFNAYADENPKGFGLLQRDRDFDHYQDDGVFYNRRPSVWVAPKGDWGKGAVDLVEIPAVDETFDNIVAFWNPEQPLVPGQERLFGYRLYWSALPPVHSPLGRCVATRTGLGGVVGQVRAYYSRRFVVDFVGGPFPLESDVEVVPVIDHSAGRVEIASARPLHPIKGYRAMFDVVPPDEGLAPINLRLYLKRQSDGAPLTETWLYQWTPPAPSDRALHNPGHLG